MKKLVVVFLLLCIGLQAKVKLLSWNIENLGSSKSESEINFMVTTLQDYDVLAIQEVVAGDKGAQAVAKLADALNRTGSKWDYVISDPTSGTKSSRERYAFLWKTAQVTKVGEAWLEQKYHVEIDREPYYCTFDYEGKPFTVVNFHAIPKSKQPETEIKYFKLLPQQYSDLNLVFVGDFNCPQSHTVFAPLRKMGYLPAFTKQKTSLKRECKKGICLANEYDNIWYDTSKIRLIRSHVIHFYRSFTSLKAARAISDHIPIVFEFSLN